MHVMNDTTDPFYTSLRAGAYDGMKPSGQPCDAVYKCKKKIVVPKGVRIAFGAIGLVMAVLGGFKSMGDNLDCALDCFYPS